MGPLRPLRTVSRCQVCGFTEVWTDEVLDHGVVLLAECPRCQHRWTQRPALWVSDSPPREERSAA